MKQTEAGSEITISRQSKDTLQVNIIGGWTLANKQPSFETLKEQIDPSSGIKQITFDAQALEAWDTTLLTFLEKLLSYCKKNKIDCDQTGLPKGIRRLLEIALAVPVKKDTGRHEKTEPFLARIGAQTIHFVKSTGNMLAFTGDTFLSFVRFFTGKAQFRKVDLALFIQECGAEALPIVTLISILIGLILAFVGAVQLRMFGAEIYVANLVGIGMVREMGAMMAAIIMAGRTGAAFAAQLGTMQVNEEIDALTTFGFSPMDFLVLPRVLALVFMMPLLCLYADFMGILGGAMVGIGMLDIPVRQYFNQTFSAMQMGDVMFGVLKSIVFGILVAMSGCLQGMQCGRSASAVGLAATSAVVMAIVAIVVADGLFAVISNILGI